MEFGQKETSFGEFLKQRLVQNRNTVGEVYTMTKRNMRKNKCVSLLLAVLCALLCAAPLFACAPKESPWSIREETPEQAFRSDEFSYRLLPERGAA